MKPNPTSKSASPDSLAQASGPRGQHEPQRLPKGASDAGAPAVDANDPALQGEGNYTATRRHRESLKNFIDSGQVEAAAEDAAPRSASEEREMRDAEAVGRAHAKP